MLKNHISVSACCPSHTSVSKVHEYCISSDGAFVIYLKDRANEIYKKVEDQKSTRGRNQDALLAACLYIACRQEDKPRTVKGTA